MGTALTDDVGETRPPNRGGGPARPPDVAPVVRGASPLTFLNEVAAAHPHALNLAAGAPHLSLLSQPDLVGALDRFRRHQRTAGMSEARVDALLLQYGPASGIVGGLLAQALSSDEGFSVEGEDVVVTTGAQAGLVTALITLADPRTDTVAVVEPVYPGVVAAARLVGVPLVGVPEAAEPDDGPDLAHLRRLAEAERARGRCLRTLYAAPDFANPSGRRWSLDARRSTLAVATALDMMVLEDTTYRFTADPRTSQPPCLSALDPGGRVILVGTMAKIAAPGLRVGYLVARGRAASGRRLADHLAQAATMLNLNTSPLTQAMVGGLLLQSDCSLGVLAAPKSAFYRHNLTTMVDALDQHLTPLVSTGVRWSRPEGGFFVPVDIGIPADMELARQSARAGVLWSPMGFFSLSGATVPSVRLACSALGPDGIVEAVDRLAVFLDRVLRSKGSAD